jgi:ABC-type lipoprotein release transport system permease subunit
MSAVWLWVRSDLRRRWRSWAVLGLLAGISVGLACAAVAGARRTERAAPAFIAVAHIPTAAVLANDPRFDSAEQRAVAALPEVKAVYPFFLGFMTKVERPKGVETGLIPKTASTLTQLSRPLVDGRQPDPHRADEIVVNEVMRRKYGLDVGSTVVYAQELPPDLGELPPALVPQDPKSFRQSMRVVGILKSTTPSEDLTPSVGFYRKYRDNLVGLTNQFVDLKHGERDFTRFQRDVQRVIGRPINVDKGSTLFGVGKVREVGDVEERGLLLFAVAVLIGAGALVGQALVRAVSAGAADLPTLRAMGADRGVVVRALVLPTLVTAAVGAVTAVVLAIALSPRFPIALTRRYELDIGFHADWLVLGLGAVLLVLAVVVTAWATAEIRIRRREVDRPRPSLAARLTGSTNLSPPLLIGSQLAVEPGRGRRAVPVRSALVGAVVGVLGVVGCLTFRAGLSGAVNDPSRSGIVWDMAVAADGQIPAPDVARIADRRDVAAATAALWARAVRIDGVPTPTWGVRSLEGSMRMVVLEGRLPRSSGEIAFAPETMEKLGVHIGDHVEVGTDRSRPVRVVGRVLVPASSHTEYDESGLMTRAGLQRVIPEHAGPEFTEDWILIRARRRADLARLRTELTSFANRRQYFVEPAKLPDAVDSLGQLRSLPFALAVFFGLLAVATVAHALVTTVRRRRVDLAVLRSLGFTKRDSRLAIAWQATLIAIVGLVVGVPLGIFTGRLLWRQLAESFPVVYVPPLALLAVLLVVPLAIAVANVVAAGPAHAATRIRPARVLRSE